MLKIAEKGESSHFASIRSAAQLISDFCGKTRGIEWDGNGVMGYEGIAFGEKIVEWDGIGFFWDPIVWD